MAGLVAALGSDNVLGIHVGAVEDPRAIVSDILADMPGVVPDASALRIRSDQVGEGTERLPRRRRLTDLAAELRGVVLDPIYTARALSGLRAAVVAGDIRPGQTTVFLHTGGLPGTVRLSGRGHFRRIRRPRIPAE